MKSCLFSGQDFFIHQIIFGGINNKNFLNRVAIKQEARAFIRPDKKWFHMFLAWLPLLLVSGVLSVRYDYQTVFNGSWEDVAEVTAKSSMFGFIGSIISLLLIPFNLALCGYFLNHIRGFNPEWTSLYREGKDRFGKYFETGFITGIVIFLWSLLFIIPGIVKTYAYSQVGFIIHDNPKLSTQDVRKISDLMTKGYKGELFVKDLSFILWYLFVGVTFGFGFMYVGPYMQVTNAMYYENLKNHAIEAGLVAPEAFGIINNPVDESAQQGFDTQNPYTGAATFYAPNQPVNNGYQAPVNNGFEPAAPVVPVAPVIPTPVEPEIPTPVEPEVDASKFEQEPITFTGSLEFLNDEVKEEAEEAADEAEELYEEEIIEESNEAEDEE